MKILVFGKTGQVAQSLQNFATKDIQVEALSRDMSDLRAPDTCAAIIASSNADVVINAAAYTAVDQAEDEEGLATLINATAPEAMARAAALRNLPFLHISTDYVFDGTQQTTWKTSDVTAPLNAYGRSKLAGERAIQKIDGPSAILRTSWIFSSHGKNFVTTMLRLSESRKNVSIVCDQFGGPTPADAIANTLVNMAAQMVADISRIRQGEIYHYCGAPMTNWANFARETFRAAQREILVDDVATEEYPTKAQRPRRSYLCCKKLEEDFGISPPDWREYLATALTEIKNRPDWDKP